MKRRVLTCLLLAASVIVGAGGPPVAAERPKEMVFFVASAASQQPLPWVDLITVDRDGTTTKVARTDKDGYVRIDRSLVGSSAVVLFCSKRFFCGAFVVDDRLLEFDEKAIQLAPIVMY